MHKQHSDKGGCSPKDLAGSQGFLLDSWPFMSPTEFDPQFISTLRRHRPRDDKDNDAGTEPAFADYLLLG